MNKASIPRLILVVASIVWPVWQLLPRHYVDISSPQGNTTARVEVLSPARGWKTEEFVLRCTTGGGKVGEAEALEMRMFSPDNKQLGAAVNVGAGFTPKNKISMGEGLPDFRLHEGVLEPGAEYRIRMVAEYMSMGLDLVGGSEIVYQIPWDEIRRQMVASGNADQVDRAADHREMLGSAISVFRKKLDNSGLKEIYVQGSGDDRILVQLPGLRKGEVETIKTVLETQGKLEFKIVHESREDLEKAKEYVAKGKKLPLPGFPYELVYMAERDQYGRQVAKPDSAELVVARTSPLVTGQDIERAWSGTDTQSLSGGFAIHITFNARGTKKFAKLTENNTKPVADSNKRLAIILDGYLRSAPVLREPITGGECQITGSFTKQEAENLVTVLRSGAIDFKPRLLSENTVGPSLGTDSIRSGFLASLVGGALVVVFMLVYYGQLGMLANFAMALNIVLLGAFMTLFGGTLTLPGIAGYALTMGMAVDTNILIYERLREEMGRKQHVKAAVARSFDRAFITIIDCHLTTIITAVILYLVGNSGPIRGFCLSLIVGLAVNLFTAVFVTQTLLTLGVDRGWIKDFKFHGWMVGCDYEFLRLGRILRPIVFAGIAVGAIFFFRRGGEMLDVDFTSGHLLQVSLTKEVDISAVREACTAAGVEASVQRFGLEDGRHFVIRAPEMPMEKKVAFQQALMRALPMPADLSQAFPSDQTVGAVAATEMFLYAGGALILAMLALLVYIFIRFHELKYGVGACLSLGHDILVCLAGLGLAGIPINISVFAALMTVVGYSLNDTVVVFDRMRENIGQQKSFDMAALSRRSINETLSRTILTVLTVFFVVAALYFIGGGVIHGFAFVMLIGMFVGVYSTLFIAVPFVVWAHGRERDAAPAEAAPAASAPAPGTMPAP